MKLLLFPLGFSRSFTFVFITKYTTMNFKFLYLILIFSSVSLKAQSLQLEEIMKGDAFIGPQPENPRWSLDGQKMYFDWNPKNEPGSSTYYWKKGMKSPNFRRLRR